MARKLSRGHWFATLAAMAGGVGLCVILAACLPPTTLRDTDREGTGTMAPTSLSPAPASSVPAGRDTSPVASLLPSPAAAASPTLNKAGQPAVTFTHTPASTPTATRATTAQKQPTATPQPTLTTTLTPSATAPSPTLTPGAAPGESQAIIIDHTCTDLAKIPDYWLGEAKKLAIHYAHTSHGKQINMGLMALGEKSAEYRYWIFSADASPSVLPGECAGALCIYDGGPTDVTFWSTTEGRNQTRMTADTGLYDASIWSWCGQQSWNDTGAVQLYLDTMRAFEKEYPGMRFVLMTGHTDGGSAKLKKNNDMVRQYARANGMVLYDFADIESYDPDGNYYPDTDDDCQWCGDWCASHPGDCTQLPGFCPHSHPLNCMRKADAFWWMMARLAGWDGN